MLIVPLIWVMTAYGYFFFQGSDQPSGDERLAGGLFGMIMTAGTSAIVVILASWLMNSGAIFRECEARNDNEIEMTGEGYHRQLDNSSTPPSSDGA